MRVVKHLGLALCFVLAGGAAHAETGFYAGVAIAKPDYDVDPKQTGTPSPTLFSRSFAEGDLGWTATLGYRANTYLALELSYFDFGTYLESSTYRFPLTQTSYTYRSEEVDLSVNGPALSALGTVPVGAGFELYVRGGVMSAEFDVKSISRRISSGEKWLAGGGLQWTFLSAFAARVEYLRLDTVDGESRTNDVDVDQYSFGLTVSF